MFNSTPDHAPESFPGAEERSQAFDQEILEFNWAYTTIKKVRKGCNCVHGVQFTNDRRACERCNELQLTIAIINWNNVEELYQARKRMIKETRPERKQLKKKAKLEQKERKDQHATFWLRRNRIPPCPNRGIICHYSYENCRICDSHHERLWRTHQQEQKGRKKSERKSSSGTKFVGSINAIMVNPVPDKKPKKPSVGVYKIRNDPQVKIPVMKHNGDAGYDLQTITDEILEAGSTTTISTGLGFKIPEGFCGKIIGRSSLAASGLSIIGGLIDQEYQGEIKVILVNLNQGRTMQLTAYDRIAQIIFIPVLNGPLKVEEPPTVKTPRGTQGFGSTGIHAIQKNKKIITEFQDGRGIESKWAYKTGEHLTPDQEKAIHRLMNKYSTTLATSFEEIKGSNILHKHDIDTGDAEPIRQAPYPLPYQYKQWVEEEIQTMLKNGIIEHSHSPWSSPIVIAPKKTTDGKTAARLCVNYKKLNAKTKKDAHPLPRVNEILEQMQGNPGYFTTINLFMGFNQIGLTKRAQDRCVGEIFLAIRAVFISFDFVESSLFYCFLLFC